MKQLLEKKQGTRAIVFALLLTMMAWLVPANVGIAKAATIENGSAVKVGKPLYKKCAGKIYYYRDSDDNFIEVHFRDASKGKIKLYLVKDLYGSGYVEQTPVVTGKVKGNTVKLNHPPAKAGGLLAA